MSTTEVEYMAVVEVAKEGIWLNSLLGSVGIQQEGVIVYCDSQSARHLAKKIVYHMRTKHIETKYHKICD